LTIDLQREIPDEMKPRRIWIQAIASPPQAEPRQIDEQRELAAYGCERVHPVLA
jgi:hypothetical protein